MKKRSLTVFIANYPAPVCNALLLENGFHCAFATTKARASVDLLNEAGMFSRFVSSPSDLRAQIDAIPVLPDIVITRDDALCIHDMITGLQPLAFAIIFPESKIKTAAPARYESLSAQLQYAQYELTTSAVWLPSLGICEDRIALVLLGAHKKLTPLPNGGTLAPSLGEVLAKVNPKGTKADEPVCPLSDADRELFALVPQGYHFSAVPASARVAAPRHRGTSFQRLDAREMPRCIPNVVTPLVFFGHPTEHRSLTLREMSALVGIECDTFAELCSRPSDILAQCPRPALVLHICKHIRRSFFADCEEADVPIPTPPRTLTKRARKFAERESE